MPITKRAGRIRAGMDVFVKFASLFASLGLLVLVAGCGGGGGGSTGGSSSGGGAPIPVVSPTGTASSEPVVAASFVCPTSSTAVSSRAAGASRGAGRMPTIHVGAPQQSATALITVSYDRATVQGARRALVSASEMRAGGTFFKEFDFPRIGRTTRILSVPRADVAHALATLRAQPGVRSVGEADARRYPLAVTAPYYTNDPYFVGFSTTANNAAPTFQVQPYVENADVPGQWDLHAIHLDDAFAYSQPGNGSNVSQPNALGSAGVKIAIIDTGADLTQPDLAPKVAFQQCFLTTPGSTAQSTSSFVTDPDGHGTSVSGIAGAVPNNGFGFTGAGGRSTLYEYRVAPTPDADCFDEKKAPNDPQCSIDPIDVISAIDDAVSRGVNVISMSLGSKESDGSSGCSSGGVDKYQPEGEAVANALASNVVVVAASGNDTNVLDAPGCDAGVIAAGASALADGLPNGAGNSNGSAIAPIEYVASYSSYGAPGAAYRNPNAWGILAPGGDPQNSGDTDNLHWIGNIWTSTPSVPAKDSAYRGCGADYPYTAGGQAECRELIAGTSMSTPEVAGAAALILAVNPSYRVSPRMKTLLCSTADDINDAREGCGRLNVYRAMAVALGDTTPP